MISLFFASRSFFNVSTSAFWPLAASDEPSFAASSGFFSALSEYHLGNDCGRAANRAVEGMDRAGVEEVNSVDIGLRAGRRAIEPAVLAVRKRPRDNISVDNMKKTAQQVL